MTHKETTETGKRASRRARRLRFRLLPRRFAREDKGVVAIEFAAVALPFFYLLMAILETSLLYFMETNLNAGVETATRQVRVGAFTGDKDDFRNLVCEVASAVPSCNSEVKVDVRRFSSFSATAGTDAFEACRDGADPNAFGVDPGNASSIMLARVCFEWELFTPFMSKILEYPSGSGSRLISAVGAFRNEPYN